MSSNRTRHVCDLDLSLSRQGYSAWIDVPDSLPDSGEYHHTEVEMFSDMGGHLNVAVTEHGSRMHRRELPIIIRRAFAALEKFYRENGPYTLPFAYEQAGDHFISPPISTIRTGIHPPRPYRVTHEGLFTYTELKELEYDPTADVKDVARLLREHESDPELYTEDGIMLRHPLSQQELPATMPLLERAR